MCPPFLLCYIVMRNVQSPRRNLLRNLWQALHIGAKLFKKEVDFLKKALLWVIFSLKYLFGYFLQKIREIIRVDGNFKVWLQDIFYPILYSIRQVKVVKIEPILSGRGAMQWRTHIWPFSLFLHSFYFFQFWRLRSLEKI